MAKNVRWISARGPSLHAVISKTSFASGIFMRHIATLIVSISAMAPFGLANADSCLQFLKPYQNESNALNTLSLVTLSKSGLASYAAGLLTYHPPLQVGGRAVLTSYVSSKPLPQTFSDRLSGQQPFDVNHADNLTVSITVADSPQIEITLNTLGNAKLTFAATCSAQGVLHGVAKDADYLLRVNSGPGI